MNDKQILDNKPDGATHVEILASTKVYYLRKDKNGMGYDVFISNEWVAMNVTGYFRSLSDIERIVELEKELENTRTQSPCKEEIKKGIRVALRNLGNADINEDSIKKFADDYVGSLPPKEQGQ